MPNLYDNESQHFNESITFIYSQNSVAALEKLYDEFTKVFPTDILLTDICHYGVFCDSTIYANYGDVDEIAKECEVPEEISDCIKYNFHEKKCYVKKIMEQIIRGEIKKPKWMTYMEMYKSCNSYNDSPSTFLYLVPKERRYIKLCEALVNFLYSPNLISKIANQIHI